MEAAAADDPPSSVGGNKGRVQVRQPLNLASGGETMAISIMSGVVSTVHPPLPLYSCPTLGFPYMAPAVPGHGQCRHSCARVPLDAENKTGHTFVPLTLTVAFTPAPSKNKICLKWKMKKRHVMICPIGK